MNLESKIFGDRIFSATIELFPELTSEEIGIVISATESYKNYIRHAKLVKKELITEINRRAEQ